MTKTVEHIQFKTAAQLIAAIEKLSDKAGKDLKDQMYVKDLDGYYLTEIALEQETLTDGSIVFNLVLSEALYRDS